MAEFNALIRSNYSTKSCFFLNMMIFFISEAFVSVIRDKENGKWS